MLGLDKSMHSVLHTRPHVLFYYENQNNIQIMELLEYIQWRRGQAVDMKEQNMIIHLIGFGMGPKQIALQPIRNERTIKS